tara:strand:+ start:1426 stop:1800 length:375 start_codon:yes stop_codon:yes gene_type:complete
MSHFAEIDENKIVQRVIVIEQNILDSGNWGDPNNWIQTSYNTRGGKHYKEDGTESDDQSKALRKNYAGIGYKYDNEKDAFIAPQPYNSWTLNETTCLWEAPVNYPDDGKYYAWNEETTSWDEIA